MERKRRRRVGLVSASNGAGLHGMLPPFTERDKRLFRQLRRTEYTLLGQEDDIVVCCDLLT